MQIFLSTEGGSSTLEVDPALTVEQLKDVIEDVEFVPAELQRLQFGTRTLRAGAAPRRTL